MGHDPIVILDPLGVGNLGGLMTFVSNLSSHSPVASLPILLARTSEESLAFPKDDGVIGQVNRSFIMELSLCFHVTASDNDTFRSPIPGSAAAPTVFCYHAVYIDVLTQLYVPGLCGKW
jgi:hypothetical protein